MDFRLLRSSSGQNFINSFSAKRQEKSGEEIRKEGDVWDEDMKMEILC